MQIYERVNDTAESDCVNDAAESDYVNDTAESDCVNDTAESDCVNDTVESDCVNNTSRSNMYVVCKCMLIFKGFSFNLLRKETVSLCFQHDFFMIQIQLNPRFMGYTKFFCSSSKL